MSPTSKTCVAWSRGRIWPVLLLLISGHHLKFFHRAPFPLFFSIPPVTEPLTRAASSSASVSWESAGQYHLSFPRNPAPPPPPFPSSTPLALHLALVQGQGTQHIGNGGGRGRGPGCSSVEGFSLLPTLFLKKLMLIVV